MIEIMKKCNEMKTASRKINEGCQKIFCCLFLRENLAMTDAIITTIKKNQIILIIPSFNLTRTIDLKKIKSIKEV